MSRSRAFNRFHRWTAKVRRRHLKAWLPEAQDVAETSPVVAGQRRRLVALKDLLREAESDLNDPMVLEDGLSA